MSIINTAMRPGLGLTHYSQAPLLSLIVGRQHPARKEETHVNVSEKERQENEYAVSY